MRNLKMFRLIPLFLIFHQINAEECGPGNVYNSLTNKCLQYFRTTVDFSSAEAICAASMGHLASISTAIENNFISSTGQRYVDGAIWIGAKASAEDVTNPLNWYWTDGSQFTYTNYKAGEPSRQGTDACMQLQIATTKWQTANCTKTAAFVCELGTITQPTCPTVVVPSHCPSGYTWYDETDHCYRSYVRKSNFADARSTCEADGGDLASIHSQNENDFLVDLSKTGLTVKDKGWNDQVWIGLTFTNEKWQWTDGTDVNYLNWGDGEPNDMDKEWWTVLVSDPHESKNTEEKRWNNVAQIDSRAFLCKMSSLH